VTEQQLGLAYGSGTDVILSDVGATRSLAIDLAQVFAQPPSVDVAVRRRVQT
jgi:hypothetical protein